MTLERYALGQDDSSDTFCRWIEFGTPHLGSIKGGSAFKLIIFKRCGRPGWHFPSEFRDEQAAWRAVRDDFVKAFDAAAAGDWNAVDGLPALRTGPALRVKTLHVYFPGDLLPIGSLAHLRHFLARVGAAEAGLSGHQVVLMNRALLAELRSVPALADWSTNELERLLYHWADPREARRILKIAPGENARFWPDCLAGGYICVGWDAVGDLREFESKDDFRARFEKEYAATYRNHAPQVGRKANEVWRMFELEPGDLVVANRGTSHVLAVGEVVEPGYEWRPERPEYRHTVRVKWDTSLERDIPPQDPWALVTVAKVPDELYRVIVAPAGPAAAPVPGPAAAAASVEPVMTELSDALERRGQAILYGPPGTGKTYVARRFAVYWLLKVAGRADAAAVLADPARFAEAERELSAGRAEPRVWWLVANPSEWSWDRLFKSRSESYRYGRIRRNYPLVQPGDLAVGYQSGPDRRIAAVVRIVRGIGDHGGGEPTIVVAPVAKVKDGPTYDELSGDPVLGVSEPMRFRNQGTLFALTPGEARRLLTWLGERDPQLQPLPQSKEGFCVPPNVRLLGTMNTADRSIRALDAALRRRFAFLELMPDSTRLEGARVGNLPLADFLEELNRRIARREGREKQVGHSFLMRGGRPITTPEEFALAFRQEILPLLQEYCHDDYADMAEYIGGRLVDKEAQTLDRELLDDPDRLLETLQAEFAGDGESAA